MRILLFLIFFTYSFIYSQTFNEINSPLSTRVSVLHINNNNELFAGGATGLYKTNNMGLSWDTVLVVNTKSLFIYNDSTWFLCTYDGIYKTLDYGKNWLPIGHSLPTTQITDITINQSDSTIFAATNSGLYKSTDDGFSWILSITNYTSTQFRNNMIENINDTLVYLAVIDANSYYQNLFRSTDNGVNWVQSSFYDSGAISKLFKTSSNILFLNYTLMDIERLYRSTNNGDTWDLLINYNSIPITRYGPIEELEGNILIMQKQEAHNMGTLTSLVISNNNFGTRNIVYPTRIYADNITVFTHTLNNDVFVGLDNGKIYKSNDPLTNIDDNNILPLDFLLSQNYPNPFNPSTKISWQSPISGWQTLKVYDILGIEVATLLNEFKPAGNYEVEFNANKFSSGVYYYQLRAGDFVETKKMILIK